MPQVIQTRDELLYAELWISLASLLRGYAAAQEPNDATIEWDEKRITVRRDEK